MSPLFLTPESPQLATLSPSHLKEILGGKGAGLCWLHQQGLRVPPFVVFSTEVWKLYKTDPKGTMQRIKADLPLVREYLTKAMGGYMPLVSVRSGARVSCPGMMDTILNVGLDPMTTQFWLDRLGEECHANSWHRLVGMYGSVVHGLDRKTLEAGDASTALKVYERKVGPFPDAEGQLLGAIEAVFKSWDNERAVYYRKINNIPDEWGTAVTVQAMVFGNLNEDSCTGVMFTRDPDTGDDHVVGDFLVKAQGEDVVAGIVTPTPLVEMVAWNEEVSDELLGVAAKLESLLGDMQDIEFTVQDKVLYILQTRSAKRTAKASVKLATEHLKFGGKPVKEVFSKLTHRTLVEAQVEAVLPTYKVPPFAKGAPACAGVARGVITHSSSKALKLAASGKAVVLVTEETCPDDIEAMHKAKGVLTMKGGATSHAAVVARSFNRCCVVGVGRPVSDFPEGSEITVDGNTGRVWLKADVPTSGEGQAGVEELLAAALKSAVEIGGTVPLTHRQAYVLDLSDKLHYSLPDLSGLVSSAMAKVSTTLYVSFLYLNDPDLGVFYQQFFRSDKDSLETRARSVIASLPVGKNKPALKLLGPSFGQTLPPHVQASPALPTTVEDLLKVTAPGKYSIIPQGGLPTEALLRIQGWMAAEGIFFVPINTYVGEGEEFCSRTVMLRELLG